MLSTLVWIAQVAVAALFALAGTVKLVLSREQLAPKMHWAAGWPRERIKLLGLAEVAGAVGLVAPAATGIATALTPVAAVCLAVLMMGAVRTHQRLGESFVPAVVLGVLCLGIAAGHFITLTAGSF
jgi:hypothetical protein